MQQQGCETVNPNVKAKTFFYTEVVRMDELRFPSRPDQTLTGTRYLKRQMIPEDDTSEEIGFPRDSFLWKSQVQTTKDFDTHFDAKSFHESHGHLLPPTSDHSVELEKNLRNRRRRIATASSVDSKMGQGFTSTDDNIARIELQSPYDELTYEETLFEVDDDRIQARSASSNEEDESELTSINRSMVLSMNRRKRQKINNKDLEDNISRSSFKPLLPDKSHHRLKHHHLDTNTSRKSIHGTANLKLSYPQKSRHRNFISEDESIDDIIPKDVLEEYIEERIRSVEAQIRNEVLRDSQNMRRHPRDKTNRGISLLDKVPEQYSIELEQADESSRDSLMKEIAAVLVSKGYMANNDVTMSLPKEIVKIAKEKGGKHSSASKCNSVISGRSSKRSFGDVDRSRPTERRMKRRDVTISPPSTFRSNKDSSRVATSLDSEKSSIKNADARARDGVDARRRKLKSSGSRSSLTSLIRTPDSSSSSDETTPRREPVKRSHSSSKKSSVISAESNKKHSNSKKNISGSQDAYDNVLFKNKENERQKEDAVKEIQQPHSLPAQSEQKYYEFHSLSQSYAKDGNQEISHTMSEVKALQANHVEELPSVTNVQTDLMLVDGNEDIIPPLCPPPPSSLYSTSSGMQSTQDQSNHTSSTGIQDSLAPAPPPRKKGKSGTKLQRSRSSNRGNIPQGIYSNSLSKDNNDGVQEIYSASSVVLHGDRSASEFFVMNDHTTGIVHAKLFSYYGV